MLNRRNVMISIHTERRGISIPLFSLNGDAEPDSDSEEEEEPEEEEKASDELPEWDENSGDESEQADLLMEGKLVITSGRAELVYEESELTGMEGAVTKICFERSTPDLVSMLRSGTVSTALVFEAGRRHICVYQTPFSCFEVCVQTLEVQNRLLQDGTLFIDYLIELHGMRTEHCRMNLRICDTDSAS